MPRHSIKIAHLAIVGWFAVAVFASAAWAQGNRASSQATEQARMEKEVRRALVTQPFYTLFDNLAFKVDGDHVTLMGQVVNPTLKIDAANTVKSLEGVAAVDNQIEVLPVSPADNRIRRAVFRAVYSAPGMQKYAIQAVPPIHIIVKNGHVTLMGVVLNESDKALANLRAKTVSGVFSVTNQLVAENK